MTKGKVAVRELGPRDARSGGPNLFCRNFEAGKSDQVGSNRFNGHRAFGMYVSEQVVL